MAHANVTILLGNLCKDPNLRFTPSGKAICDLLVAVNRKSGATDYLPVVVWGRDAEACDKFLKKGSLVHIVGRTQSRNYEKPDGSKHVAIEIVAQEIEFLDKASGRLQEEQEDTSE
jgi:single-strand DNA-binding protein